MAKKTPDRERLDELLIYDPILGRLSWRSSGERAGWNDGRYIKITIDDETYYAHRIVWKLKTGLEPSFIDHENLNRSDLRWDNLRDGTKSENQGNRLKRSDNTSGFKNIHWCDDRARWVVQVRNGPKKMARRCRTLAGAIAFQRYVCALVFGKFARAA